MGREKVRASSVNKQNYPNEQGGGQACFTHLLYIIRLWVSSSREGKKE